MTDPETARAGVLAHIDAHHAEQVEFLAELVRVPSDNPPGDCAAHAARAATLLEVLGFTVERHPVPAEAVRASGMISATNLIVRHRFGAGPTVALNAHGDVVPPGAGWTSDPYGAEQRGGRMYGRGVAVSKSDFATYAFALAALRDTGAALGGTVELHLTYDEETGGAIGPAWLLAQGLTRPDYAVSAGFAHAITVAHNGCLHVEVTVRGRSAHAARPDTGVDALEAATKLLTVLYAMRPGLAAATSGVPGIGHPSLVVGLIKGGINTNVVPDMVTFRVDRRIIPEESAEQAEADLRAAITEAAAAMPGITVEVTRILLATPLGPVPGQEHLVAALRAGAVAAGYESLPTDGTPIYTDARLYSGAGIPTVLFGAGPKDMLEANGHRANENLLLDDLRRATRIVALGLVALLLP
jgi:acetylornithine deacetylase/succinyl-diaminopimelate desuccinylase-like protein